MLRALQLLHKSACLRVCLHVLTPVLLPQKMVDEARKFMGSTEKK